MKYTILTFLLFNLFHYSVLAQSVNDSTSMNSLYTNQVFYSLDNGEVANINNNDWELGFSAFGNGAAGSAIILNEANTTLWAYPGDTSDWSTFDTSNYQNWEQLLNTDTSWTNGAFNKHRGATGLFDMGWGVLNPMNNFWTFGDSLYLTKLSDNSFKKLWIVSLKTGIWEFKYANIDGSNEQIFTIDKTNYPNRNFVYHSMINDTTIDREPNNTSWDIMFAKHTDYISFANQYVSVTSVFNNRNVWSAKAHETDSATAAVSVSPQTNFNQKIDNIGREWKKFSSSTGWTVYDSIAYFIYDNDSTDFYRIVFTGFGGTGSGKSYFNIEHLNSVNIKTINNNIQYSLYPNPTQNNVTLLLNQSTNENFIIEIISLTGNKVFHKEIYGHEGTNHYLLPISHLSSGIYIVNVKGYNFNSIKKLVVK